MSDDLEQQFMLDPAALQQRVMNKKAKYDLQQAQLEALKQAFGNYGNFRYVNLENFLNPDNPNWNDYTYKLPTDFGILGNVSPKIRQGRVGAASPIGMFIQYIRDAKTIDDVKKQYELWNSYNPLDSTSNGSNYVRYLLNGGRPVSPTTNESDPVQATTGGTQDVQTGNGTQGTQGTQGAQDVQAGNAAAKGGTQDVQATAGGTQGSNNGSGGTQGTNNNGGTYTLGEVAKGGTKTIGYDPYDPNPGNVSLAYTMRNAPEQERRAALIDEWNREHGISYATGKDGLIYRTDPQHPNGYVDPFKNDLSKTGSTYASPGISTGGTYATGQGIKDANGNVLTNPGGNWEYQYALKNPQYGLGMMGKMSDAQRNYLQAVSDDMGYHYNFKGATRFV